MKTTKLQGALDRMESTLLYNIMNHILSYEFHATATDEEIAEYYGGAGVNRQALLRDTLKHLASDQTMLKFLQANKGKFIKAYGDDDITGDLSESLQRATGVSVKPEGWGSHASEDEPGESIDPGVRSADDADEGDHSEGQAGDLPGGTGAGGDETERVPADDGGDVKDEAKA